MMVLPYFGLAFTLVLPFEANFGGSQNQISPQFADTCHKDAKQREFCLF